MSDERKSLRTIFNDALEIGDAQKRAEYLAAACGADAALRRSVEELMQAHDETGRFLGGSEESIGLGGGLAAEGKVRAEKPGHGCVRYFGDYQLLEEIARGGMGIVFKARQTSLNRIVALKMILAGRLASPALVQRFHTEAEAAANLKHPNIVTIHEVGEHEGQHYFSMDYVEGADLAKRIEQGPMPLNEAASCLQTIASAIHYAHQRGVLHRDLKPSNILLDQQGKPHVTDFGLAKLAERETNLTQSRDVMGSPSYMPPEQAAGDIKQLTIAADIYSLGAILYELLSGRPPYRSATPLETMRQVIEEEPESPSLIRNTRQKEAQREAGRRNGERVMDRSLLAWSATEPLDRDLETICLKCLSKDPAERYGSAEALAQDLERWHAGEPILARPAGQMERFWRWCRRNPKTAILRASAILLLLAVAIGSMFAAVRIRTAQNVATERLFNFYLTQAHKRRADGREGQRFESLETVAKAARIRSSPELRNEAIACMAMTDVRFSAPQEAPDPEESWSANLELRALRKPVGIVSVRRTRDNKEIALLPSQGGRLLPPLGFSPDGRFLALTYANGRHVVWDVNQQQLAITNIPYLRSVDFSADGQMLVAHCGDGKLRRFGLNPIHESPSLVANPRYHGIRLRPQGDWFGGYEPDKAELEICDLRDGSLLRTISHPSRIGTFVWSDDGRYLAVGCDNGRIHIWNALTGEKQMELQGHQDSVTSVGFSHSGWLLGSSSWDGQFRLWDLAAARTLVTVPGWSYQAMFSADDLRIGRVQRGRQSGSLELTPSSIFRWLNCKPSPLRGSWSTDVSSDGRLVAAAFQGGVRIWADQQTEEPFVLPAGPCVSVIFTSDGTNLITCGPSGVARWPMKYISGATADELQIGPPQLIREAGDFNFAALSRDGHWVAAANSGADAVSVYEVYHPTNHFRLLSQPHIQSTAISPDGRWVAAGNWKGSGVKVWDFESRQILCTLPTLSSATVAFSPDNRWLGVSADGFDLWETRTWLRKYAISRDRPELRAAAFAFSPDGRTLAIRDEPGVIRLVVADTGEVLAVLEAPRAAIISYLRFSADGSQLFALQWDQQVEVWDLRHTRAELAKLNLDWNAPPLPPLSQTRASKPLHISLIQGSK